MSGGSSYGGTVKPLITNLYQAVVGLGLLAISMQYVQAAYRDPVLLRDEEYPLRWVLLAGVVGFSCYCMLSYQATRFEGRIAPLRLLGMYGLEIVHVAICAWKFAVLAPYASPGAGSGELFGPVGASLSLIFGLAAAWHALVLLWYAIAPLGVRGHVLSLAIHGAFFVAHGALALLSSRPGVLPLWLGASAYAVLVAVLFGSQGFRALRGSVVLGAPGGG